MKILILLFLLTGCSLGQINRQTEFENDLFNEETLLRFNSVAIKKLSKSKNIKIASLAKCHQGNKSEGLKDLKDNYSKMKQDPLYWNVIGTCYYIDDNMPKASFYFQHALSLSGKSKSRAYTFNNLGVILLKQRHYDQAFEMFSKSSRINKSLLTPKFNLAQLHIQFGQIEEAEKILIKLSEIRPNDIDVLTSLAVIALIGQDYKRAITIYESIEEDELQRSDIAGYYALALFKDGKYKKAKYILEKQDVSTEEAFYKLNRELASHIKDAIRRTENEGRETLQEKL